MSKFKSCDNKGFHMEFGNGWTISVQFGTGNYCDNKWNAFDFEKERKEGATSSDAEIAVFRSDGEWYELSDYDQVEGYLDTDDVLEVMNWVARQPTL